MNSSQRPNYAKIPLQKRQTLIQMVFQEHMSIAKAGRKLLIKPSTAKLIVRKYKQTGDFFIKKAKKPEEEMQNPNQFSLMPPTNVFFCQVYPKAQMAENSVKWNQPSGINEYQNNGYFMWPMDLSAFTLYY